MKTANPIIKAKLTFIGFIRRAFIFFLTLMIRRSFFRKILGLLNDKNKFLLEELINTVKTYSQYLRINNVNFSGILPNVLQRKSICIANNAHESREYVCSVIHKSEQILQKLENIPNNSPLIILGGNGFIGQYLCTKFIDSGRELHIVDVNIPFPKHLTGQQTILIDVARKGAIDNYVSDFWQGLVVLNETYPEPSRKSLVMLRKIGVKVYHIADVKAKSFPAFPLAYENAIPCCAMHSASGVVPHVIKLV